MKRLALCMILSLILVHVVEAQTIVTPEIVNWAVVAEQDFPCPGGNIMAIRDPAGWCWDCPPYCDFDICDEYTGQFFGQAMTYGPPYYAAAAPAVGVGGINLPAGQFSGDRFNTLPYVLSVDDPDIDPNRRCIDAFELTSHPTANIQGTAFSYLIFDMTDYVGCEVNDATLAFRVSPWYSGSAQPVSSDGTVNVGIYGMNPSCEDIVLEAKRGCLGALANDPGNNPIPFDFPLPAYADYVDMSINVTNIVQTSLGNPGGYVGIILDSMDIDSAPGMRGVGMAFFELTVDVGACNGAAPVAPETVEQVPTITQWSMLLLLLCLAAFSVWKLRKATFKKMG